jgi:Protein phosphatase 2C
MFALLRRHGVAVYLTSDANDQSESVVRPPILLPYPMLDDPEVKDRVPLKLSLDEVDLTNFGRGGSFAVSFFGPDSLASDKVQNEDFALAGVIDAPAGSFPFGIVADGVTSKTFWSARASRLATFAAYGTIKSLLLEGWEPAAGDVGQVDLLTQRLSESIDRHFLEDRDALIGTDAIPVNWNEALYRQYADRLLFWYQTTLLLVVLGPKGGWFIFCGDGGAIRFLTSGPTITDSKVALESPDTVELPSAVTIGVTPLQFTRIFLRPPEAGQSLQVVLSSDGIDRSLKSRRAVEPDVGYATLDLSSHAAAQSTVQMIAQWAEADRDNMSLVRVCFPPDSPWPRPAALTPKPRQVFEKDTATLSPADEVISPWRKLRWRASSSPTRAWPRRSSRLNIAVTLFAAFLFGASLMLVAVAAGPGERWAFWVKSKVLAKLTSTSRAGINRPVPIPSPEPLAGEPDKPASPGAPIIQQPDSQSPPASAAHDIPNSGHEGEEHRSSKIPSIEGDDKAIKSEPISNEPQIEDKP